VAALGGDLETAAPPPSPDTPAPDTAWTRRAMQLMQEAEERLRAGDFAGFGSAWNRLKTLLEQQGSGVPQR
jgi:hypothetical protein